jgi:hypothetical protein
VRAIPPPRPIEEARKEAARFAGWTPRLGAGIA